MASGIASPARRRSAARTTPRAARLQKAGFELIQRERMLLAVAETVEDGGFAELTVSAITAHARISRRTFYEQFGDREQALAATAEESLARVSAAVLAAHRAREQDGWRAGMQAGLEALLRFLDEEPAFGSLLIVGVHGGGPALLRRRSEVIRSLVAAVDAGRAVPGARAELSPAAAEAVVGAVLSILHERMLEQPRPAMRGLLGNLMSVIVRPYLGAAAAAREARRRSPVPAGPARAHNGRRSLLKPAVRMTMRTAMVLQAIAERPASSNREVAALAGVEDQGQASKLLTRLAGAGLIENANGAGAPGTANSWSLTRAGEDLAHALGAGARWGR